MLAMGQGIEQKGASCPYTVHPAWCAGGCWSTQAQKRNNDRAQRQKFTHTQLHIAKCWESTCHYPWSIYPNGACLRFVYTESPLSTLTSNTEEEICENWKPDMSQEQYGQKELLYLQVCTAPPLMIVRPSSLHCTTTTHDYQTFKLALHHHSCHNI